MIRVSELQTMYVDDTNPYECGQHCHDLIYHLELKISKRSYWFKSNKFKGKSTKCHLFLSPYKSTFISINISGFVFKCTNSEILSGIIVNSNFIFEDHINSPCQKI